MPIAMDMRTLDHIAYTPAPDIVHGSGRHVPILADPAYRFYLTQYATMANKAIISFLKMYASSRPSVFYRILENPDTRPEQIKVAEDLLQKANSAFTFESELTHVARMAWWTAEYGLVGDIKNPRIYGAGLLSSIGESQHCLSDRVRKIPLTIDCIKQSYDITEPQPQLFVAESLEILPQVLKQLDDTLAYKNGGIPGLAKANRCVR